MGRGLSFNRMNEKGVLVFLPEIGVEWRPTCGRGRGGERIEELLRREGRGATDKTGVGGINHIVAEDIPRGQIGGVSALPANGGKVIMEDVYFAVNGDNLGIELSQRGRGGEVRQTPNVGNDIASIDRHRLGEDLLGTERHQHLFWRLGRKALVDIANQKTCNCQEGQENKFTQKRILR